MKIYGRQVRSYLNEHTVKAYTRIMSAALGDTMPIVSHTEYMKRTRIYV